MRDLTSKQFVPLMGVGWNLGNALDSVTTDENGVVWRNEWAWGNPGITQTIFDAVASAGFKSVRIPVAWSEFSDAQNYVISDGKMNRVREVVDMALNAGLIVKINTHWDGGWLNEPIYSKQAELNDRLAKMWTQIATHFRDYDDRLIFAGTNEVRRDVNGQTADITWQRPTEEFYTVQNSFNQTFVDAVRKTGGRNVYRQLVVQSFNTNIDYAVDYFTLPSDVIEGRLMLEVHHYTPIEFAEGNDQYWQWGNITTNEGARVAWPSQVAGSDEAFTDREFQKIKSKFVDGMGLGVILGEYGANAKPNVDPNGVYRTYWVEYTTQSAVNHGMVPMYWDNCTGNHCMGLFDRETGAEVYPGVIDAVVKASP